MADPQTTLDGLLRAYEAALNSSDTPAVMGLYSADPVFAPEYGPALIGREAVRQGYDRVFSTIRLSVKFTIHETESFGDSGWGRTTSAGRQRVLSTNRETTEGNNELFVFKREGGGWKIHRYLFARDRPPTE